MSKVEELQGQIRSLSPEEFVELRDWFWDQDSIAWDAQIEADVKSGKLDELIARAQRRYRELVDGEVEGIPCPPLSAEERAELDRAVDAYERDRNRGCPAEDDRGHCEEAMTAERFR